MGRLVRGLVLGVTWCLLAACSLVQYQPLSTIQKVDLNTGYRFEQVLSQRANDDMLMIMVFSGGGTRAAALGYGVLEELNQQRLPNRQQSLLEEIDLVYGVSGGSVLAAYFSLHGKDTVPAFERRFLKQNFQRQITKQIFSAANLPRLTSPEFGRGDLLQEQFENTLFKNATFGDLEKHRKGPFAIISATDMSIGSRLDFTQERFDSMCLNLSDLRLARAVAASSAVPLVFSPITLNNNGGNCGYQLPESVQTALQQAENDASLSNINRLEIGATLAQPYHNSKQRPYIHLLDGGLTDNLGLRNILETTEMLSNPLLYQKIHDEQVRKIVIINVNAQNQAITDIDKSAAVPGFADVANAIINIPIDKYSQDSLRRFRIFVDEWNTKMQQASGQPVKMYFISLNLLDLPPSALRDSVRSIPTSFYLPSHEVNDLKEAARTLMQQSVEYRRFLEDLKK